jgi:hypothetical protein
MRQLGPQCLAHRRPDTARHAEPASAQPRDREAGLRRSRQGRPVHHREYRHPRRGGHRRGHEVYATYLGWPLDVTEFRSAKALTEAVKWPDGQAPGKGEPPIALAGVNILITWGPARSGHKPGKVDGRQAAALTELVAAADVLLSPLKTRTSVAVRTTATAEAEPSAAPAPSAS